MDRWPPDTGHATAVAVVGHEVPGPLRRIRQRGSATPVHGPLICSSNAASSRQRSPSSLPHEAKQGKITFCPLDVSTKNEGSF
ncbi:hypothetical protein E2562_008312 [Oryza meyeriana var. granulata]|uniref:Uncharacterized protein n=1 Tax=Oryza meyeriana var. granulata TaxID=110450 RepID=A0A6G1DFP0_9ORYZ|nr:hypothetical protein E2562_008312 [Oryza meyeriana var. granulata]